jgi:hypothetical protein
MWSHLRNSGNLKGISYLCIAPSVSPRHFQSQADFCRLYCLSDSLLILPYLGLSLSLSLSPSLSLSLSPSLSLSLSLFVVFFIFSLRFVLFFTFSKGIEDPPWVEKKMIKPLAFIEWRVVKGCYYSLSLSLFPFFSTFL